MRPLLIGQAPGPNTREDLPLYPYPRTSAGGRLLELTGLNRREYLLLFDRTNLLYYFPGRHKRDDKWPVRHARVAASAARALLTGRQVVMVGRRVADAFGVEVDWHEWTWLQTERYCPVTRRDPRAKVAVVPHPSGRNHWYNKSGNWESARAFWSEFIDEIRSRDGRA